MTQPSVAEYFSTRKRTAADEISIARAKKVLVLDDDLKGQRNNNKIFTGEKVEYRSKFTPVKPIKIADGRSKVVTKLNFEAMPLDEKERKVQRRKKGAQKKAACKDNGSIEAFLQKVPKKEAYQEVNMNRNAVEIPVHRTPPSTPTKSANENAMDKIVLTGKELSFNDLKQKMSRSSRLAELKASICKFKKLDEQLEEAGRKTGSDSPGLKAFKSIELEIPTSPAKSPTKAYLSPKKPQTPRKNLLGLLSPVKSKPAETIHHPPTISSASEKPHLVLPYKYHFLAEMFRCIDIVTQIMYNRKETITFGQLKPAVEEMQRRNLTESHLEQISCIYPEAFTFKREKLRMFGTAGKQQKYELIIEPVLLDSTSAQTQTMNSQSLIKRQQRFYNSLLDKVKSYHEEFLQSLDPPLRIPRDKIARWHPDFDADRVPDVERAPLPALPQGEAEEKITSGMEVLEKARSLFGCNTRMERALEKLKEMQEAKKEAGSSREPQPEPEPSPLLKGIPKCLLEKIRAKQAAKALETMTRSLDKEKEIAIHSRLPELARIARNAFVAEKKSVLRIDFLLEKLSDSFRTYLSNADLEMHLKKVAESVPKWMIFHEMRGTVFVRLEKNADMNLVLEKLENLLEEKKKML